VQLIWAAGPALSRIPLALIVVSMGTAARRLILVPGAEPLRLDLELPASYRALAVLPGLELGLVQTPSEVVVLASRDVKWSNWKEYSQEHAETDDGLFERLSERYENGRLVEERWEIDHFANPAHVRLVRTRVDSSAILAGIDEHAILRRLACEDFDDLSTDQLERRFEEGDIGEDERVAMERRHWSSKIGGVPSFSQATYRSRSKRSSGLLRFLAQVGPDVAFDPYGYMFYVFGDPKSGELSLTAQR
jgi:hypothetical protein